MTKATKTTKTPEDDAPVVRLTPNHDRYVRGLASTASGRDSYDIADKVADSLRAKTIDEVFEAVADQMTKLGEPTSTKDLKGRWAGRNPGMQRMNAGNVLRGAIRRAKRKSEAKAEIAAKA
jgi:hypothetical protein